MTPSATQRRKDVQQELAIANAAHETAFEFGARTLEEVEDLAAGLVPLGMRAEARAMLNFDDLLRRNAEKPRRRTR